MNRLTGLGPINSEGHFVRHHFHRARARALLVILVLVALLHGSCFNPPSTSTATHPPSTPTLTSIAVAPLNPNYRERFGPAIQCDRPLFGRQLGDHHHLGDMEFVGPERGDDQQRGRVEWLGDKRGIGINDDPSESQRCKWLHNVDGVAHTSVHRGHARESDDRDGVDGAIHGDWNVLGPEHARPDKFGDVGLDEPRDRDDKQFGRIKWAGYFGGRGLDDHHATMESIGGTTKLTVAPAGLAAVTTRQYDNLRTGQNTSETILTPSNVNASQFGKLFSQAVDGQMFAQPLYVANVAIPGKGTHNVVFAATENDTVYAFDADSNTGGNATYLWKASLVDTAHGAPAGATAAPVSVTTPGNCPILMSPTMGITSTPVIDLTTNTMYVVAFSLEGTQLVNRLHAIDITTGNEKSPGPKVIDATVSGTGDGSSNGQLTFSKLGQGQFIRPALLLSNGTIYMASGSLCEGISPYHGWLFAYTASTFSQQAALVLTPNGGGGGIWMSGEGLAADASGTFFLRPGMGRSIRPTFRRQNWATPF